jgi:hypothetical protein
MIGRLLFALLAALLVTGTLPAEDPKLPDAKTYDKLVVDTLRDVHNAGADLYNISRDFSGTYRLYHGALITVRPLLAHQPNAQKLIDAGLAEADKESNVSLKAFKLHETIENVRGFLKTGIMPLPKPDDTKKPAETKSMPPTETKKPAEKKPTETPESKKTIEKKPTITYELAPLPREKK